ncbi:MAG: glycosyltransferase family 2 protein [Candidatus Omnitrophica bacterium]|nr:glycosyltransferase family 2 protein [Candidatus Omnitrophota bacterium]
MEKLSPVYSVVVPVFNEQEVLPAFYERLKNTLDNLGLSYEIVFVDDGSTDGSYSILKNFALNNSAIHVVSFKMNFGQHRAVTAGLRAARGDYVIALDADLQNPPEEIPKLIMKMKEGFDMVAGVRKLRKDTFGRRFSSLITNAVIRLVTGLSMSDYGSMLRIFKRETASKLARVFEKNQGYITMLVAKVTHHVGEVEVDHDQRYAGTSKYTFRKLFVLFFKIFCYYDWFSRFFIARGNEPLYVIDKEIEYGKEIIKIARP